MTKIKVFEVFEVSSKVFFEIKVEEGKYLIGDIYEDLVSNLKFQITGIGMDNIINSKTDSVLVKNLTDNLPLSEFKNKIFYKV
ncbi:hypothetical protein [Flavobacterium terrisoli]|uniref:hypothetical protein n=1 Tax=Flavobacterium terrisoli TaxID=3242195 RepID=UPI002542817F|nr:hypothetical protein [Flavobacterium buctense]